MTALSLDAPAPTRAFPLPPGFLPRDLDRIRSLGRTPEEIAAEVEQLRRGVPPVQLLRPCDTGDGIVSLRTGEENGCVTRFQRDAPRRRIVKFIAASGSASRMFGALRSVASGPLETLDELRCAAGSGDPEAAEVCAFIDGLERFAFFGPLSAAAARGGLRLTTGNWKEVLHCVADPGGLGYGRLPKALIPFHVYPEGPRTALEEHLLESAGYAEGADGLVRVHLTVSPEHLAEVRAHVSEARPLLSRRGIRCEIGVSVQKRSTNTVVLNDDGTPERDTDGELVFKPAGHGALLGNLSDLEGDVVFLRTVDNIFPAHLHALTAFYKKVLGGLLFRVERQVHASLRLIHSGRFASRQIERVREFAERELSVRLPAEYGTLPVSDRARVLFDALNRPLRVCGMVPNGGDPGGAPFWVRDASGREQLRIVEQHEVDQDSPAQRRIWESSAWFNPADIVCSLRDFEGRPFRLADYCDPEAWLGVRRRQNGRPVRVLERPGLWNGGMAGWNTVFAAVPRATVHPVKSVVDLLSWQHQPFSDDWLSRLRIASLRTHG